ncbi:MULTISPECIES: acetyltransferase [unclassified Bacillus (in: firmicutes)]|uniref:acetyltransferase n=1 Tax=unclassified Bacillus (in: firmicutes) TaxID=185979 RepID=UPI002281485F|nr:acetyltransferase [Bacillus sp. S20C3]MCY8204310.1 acetyltransferase [Bacillus sp. N12A5]MCY8288650.1 acetyltransferase [Bacillus sp. N13C7]MCY8636278.1 acetyltransferase [Bacillus sp. S17B2]MCY8720843.1 acetyltransferase [Bacillus sp. S10C12M]MCY9142341.1 acetyltransferase [Bacillus sp. T9C1]
MRNVAIVGDGGHGKVIRELINARSDTRLAAVLDDKFRTFEAGEEWFTGPPEAVSEVRRLVPDVLFLIAIGNNRVRKQVAERLDLKKEDFITLIHPSAIVSKSAVIGEGTVIMAGAIIQADARIGAHCIINTGAVAEHDNQIGDYVHLSPRVTLSGAVAVQEGAHVGTGAAVIPQLTIGSWSIVGAGSAVIRSIPDRVTVAGAPARIISSIQT